MKIIIVGIGKTGESLIKNLTQEKYDIVGIDSNAARVQEVIEKYDINGIVGSGCLADILKEAGAENADLLIAVTDKDELNILSCLVGKSLGTRHLIAQVRNSEYFSNFDSLGEQFGINRFVSMEATLASRITRVLKAPAEVNLSPFGGGRLEIADFSVSAGNKIVGKKLTDIRKNHKKEFLVIAIERGEEVIVPNGETVLQAGDVLNICVKHHELRDILGYFGMEKQSVRSVMVLGSEEQTFFLAEELLGEGIDVKVIGKDVEKCKSLKARLDKLTVICDNYNDKEVLLRERIEDVDALVAMAPSDENNIVASLFAKTYEVPKVITVVGSELYREMLDDISLNLVCSPYELTGASIATYIRSINVPEGSQIVAMQKIAGGEAEALQFFLGKNEKFVGKTVAELAKKMKNGVLMCALLRGRTAIIPQGDTVLEEGDEMVVASLKQRITKLEDILR